MIILCFLSQADCIEIAKPIVDELNMLENDGILLYDALLQKEVLAVAPVMCVIALVTIHVHLKLQTT